MELKQLDIREPRVQDFLWQHLVPWHFRWDYTKLDALKCVEQQVLIGETQLWGDLDIGFMFRAVIRNPRVIEPHILGRGIYLRSALRAGLPICWGLGFEKVAIWTQHESIARIAVKMGFKREGRIEGMHCASDGTLHPLIIVTLEKRDALRPPHLSA